MKTIEEAAKEYADGIWGENYITECKNYHTDGFKSGVEFAQRWIPLNESPITEKDSSNILVKFENGKIIRYDEKNWPMLMVTHWRKIELL